MRKALGRRDSIAGSLGFGKAAVAHDVGLGVVVVAPGTYRFAQVLKTKASVLCKRREFVENGEEVISACGFEEDRLRHHERGRVHLASRQFARRDVLAHHRNKVGGVVEMAFTHGAPIGHELVRSRAHVNHASVGACVVRVKVVPETSGDPYTDGVHVARMVAIGVIHRRTSRQDAWLPAEVGVQFPRLALLKRVVMGRVVPLKAGGVAHVACDLPAKVTNVGEVVAAAGVRERGSLLVNIDFEAMLIDEIIDEIQAHGALFHCVVFAVENTLKPFVGNLKVEAYRIGVERLSELQQLVALGAVHFAVAVGLGVFDVAGNAEMDGRGAHVGPGVTTLFFAAGRCGQGQEYSYPQVGSLTRVGLVQHGCRLAWLSSRSDHGRLRSWLTGSGAGVGVWSPP